MKKQKKQLPVVLILTSENNNGEGVAKVWNGKEFVDATDTGDEELDDLVSEHLISSVW